MCILKLVNKGEESMSFTVSKKLIEVSVDYIELEDYIQVINEENKEFFNEELINRTKMIKAVLFILFTDADSFQQLSVNRRML